MPAPLDQLTTVASHMPLMPRNTFQEIKPSSVNLLYFHVILKTDGEISGNERQKSFEQRFCKYLEASSSNVRAVSFIGDKVHLLIGLEQNCYIVDFIYKLKILSKSFARRRLSADYFSWYKDYEVSTVSLSQIENVSRGIRRQRFYSAENSASFWQPISLEKVN